MTLNRILRGGGLALVSAGILILLFVAYQLWGTSITQAGHQRELRNQLNSLLSHDASVKPSLSSKKVSAAIPIVAPKINAPLPSHPIGTIQIPAIGLDQVIVEGVAEDDLSLGPGHYPGTPLPGEAGNVAIAGHRTTWGHPFYNLNEVTSRDRIIITTVQGTFTYTPIGQRVVLPTDIKVLAPSRTPELTLTTCNPRFSAAQRLVLVAKLTMSTINGRSSNSYSTQTPTRPSSKPSLEVLAAGTLDLPTSIAEGLGCLFIAGITLLSRRRIRRAFLRRIAYIAGTLGFLVVLFLFFSTISLSLPAGF